MVEWNTLRRPAPGYPAGGAFPDPVTRLIDEAQRLRFLEDGAHFASETVFTLTYQPPSPHKSRVERLIFSGSNTDAQAGPIPLDDFERESNDLVDPLRPWFDLAPLDPAETIAFIEECIGGIHQARLEPSYANFLDGSFAHEFVAGFRPQIDGRSVLVVALDDFPPASYPQILSGLNAIRASLRLAQRFVCLSPPTAEGVFESHQRNWRQKLYNFGGLLSRVAGGEARENPFALEMEADAQAARLEAESKDWWPGYYTAVVVVIDDDLSRAERVAGEVIRELRYRGFGARLETLNANDGYLGSIPANGGYNPRRPVVSNRNFADFAVNDTPPTGVEYHPCPYYPPKSPPLLLAVTSGATPVRVVHHVSDVGHTLIIGPTGAGKTTYLVFVACQHFRYENAQVFFFDRGHGAYVATLAAGGLHYDLGEGETAFCPLAGVDDLSERTWAHGWLIDRLREQGLQPTPARDQALWRALELLGDRPKNARTITHLIATIQDHELRDALSFYSFSGPMGRFVDAEEDGLGASRFITFEIEKLMAQGERVLLPVLTYLFHRIDQRLDGRPTIVVLDEAWVMLMNGTFGAKVEEWLRTLRKKNAAVILATQSVTEVANSSLRDLILESCPTKIYLPNAEARNPATAELYRKFGLTERQIELVAGATPKRQYYFASALFRRLLSLPLTAPALAFAGAGSREEIELAKRLRREHGSGWVMTVASRARAFRLGALLRGAFAGVRRGEAIEARPDFAGQSTEQSRRRCNEEYGFSKADAAGAVGWCAYSSCWIVRTAPAWAQFGGTVVFDPSMFARQLDQLQQETAAVQTLAAQLQYAVQNTTGGGAGLWRSNQGLLTNLGNIVAEQQGLSYTLSNLSSEFQRMFPGYVASQSGNVAPQAAQGFTSTLNTLNGTLQAAAAQAQDFQAEQAALTTLEAKNQGAIGQLQTIQVGNEIALQQVQQLQMLRQLMVAMINAQNVVAANQVSQAAQAQAQQQQWLSGGQLVPYPSTWSSPNAPHAGLPAGGQP